MTRIICFLFHRKYWSKKRFLGYSDHDTIARCEKCGKLFTIPDKQFEMQQKEPKPIHEQIIDAVGGEDRFREIAGLKPKQETLEEDSQDISIRFLEWYRRKNVFFQFHAYHIPNPGDKNWEQTVFHGDNSYLTSRQLFEIFKKEIYEQRNT